jgi:hypothetical protein
MAPVGQQASQLPVSGTFRYSGFSDGLALISGAEKRLYGGSGGFTADFAARTVTVDLTLVSRANPFSEFLADTPVPIGQVTGKLTLHAFDGSIFNGSLTGPTGLSGTATGYFFGRSGVGAGLIFELSNAQGDVVLGATALDLQAS